MSLGVTSPRCHASSAARSKRFRLNCAAKLRRVRRVGEAQQARCSRRHPRPPRQSVGRRIQGGTARMAVRATSPGRADRGIDRKPCSARPSVRRGPTAARSAEGPRALSRRHRLAGKPDDAPARPAWCPRCALGDRPCRHAALRADGRSWPHQTATEQRSTRWSITPGLGVSGTRRGSRRQHSGHAWRECCMRVVGRWL